MREKEQGTRVIYVRHGQADFPHDRLYCDEREDPGLTENGLRQARHAARMLAGEAVDVIYASPMLRTLRTAREIEAVTGAPLHTDARLKERPFGIWDGMYFDDIARTYPEGFRAWKADPINYVPQGGEAIRDHRVRIKMAVDEILERHPGALIVIVAHVGPIRMCITDAIGMPVEGYRQLTIDYGALTRIDYGRRQNNLVYMNYRYQPLAEDAHAI